MPLLVATL